MVRPRLVQDNSMGQTLPVPPVRHGKDRPVTATTTHLDTTPATTDEPGDEDMLHVVCACNPDQALCGLDMSGEPLVNDPGPTPDDCVVCTDLDKYTCQNCGE